MRFPCPRRPRPRITKFAFRAMNVNALPFSPCFPPAVRKPPARPPERANRPSRSYRLDIRRLLALRSLLDFEADLLVFLQRLETLAADFGEMGKQVFATIIGCDKAKALRVVEPLHCTGWHVDSSV